MGSAIVRPLLEVVTPLRHLVRDMSEADDRLAASLREGVQPGYFHLDRLQSLCHRRFYRRSGLSEWGIRRPRSTPDRLDSRAPELASDG